MLGLRRSDKGHTGEGHGDWSCPSQLAVKHMQNQSLVGSLESAAPGPSFLRAPLLFSWNSWDCAVRVNQKVWVSPEDPRWPPSSHLQPRFTSCSHRGEGRGQKFAFSVEEVVPRAGRLPSAHLRWPQVPRPATSSAPWARASPWRDTPPSIFCPSCACLCLSWPRVCPSRGTVHRPRY